MHRGGRERQKRVDDLKSMENQQAGEDEKDHPQKDAEQKAAHAKVMPGPIRSEDDSKYPGGHQQNPQDKANPSKWESLHERLKKVGFHDWVMLAATIAIAISTTLYTIYARGQLETMQKTLIEMKHSGSVAMDQTWQAIGNMNWLAREMNYARDQSANVARTGERNAKLALDTSTAAARTDQRAWMDIIINRPPSFQPDKSFSTTAEMKNLGKTPAKNIKFGDRFEGIPPSLHPIFNDDTLAFVDAGMLPPQGPATRPVEITPGKPDDPLGQGRFEAIRDGNIVAYYWGLIKYDDVFGFHHWLKFCYIYNVPHRQFNLVSMHNDIDPENR